MEFEKGDSDLEHSMQIVSMYVIAYVWYNHPRISSGLYSAISVIGENVMFAL